MARIATEKCDQIGLLDAINVPEYAVWASMAQLTTITARIEHVNVQNVSARLGALPRFASLRPCAVIRLQGAIEMSRTVRIGDRSFERLSDDDPLVQLYLSTSPR